MSDAGKSKYQALRSPTRQRLVVNASMIGLLAIALCVAWLFTERRNAGRFVTLEPQRVMDLSISLPNDWQRVTVTEHDAERNNEHHDEHHDKQHAPNAQAASEAASDSVTKSDVAPDTAMLTLIEPTRPRRTLVIASNTTPTLVPPQVVLNQIINARLTPQARTELAPLRVVRRQKYGSFIVASYAGARISAGQVEQHVFAVITQDGQHWWAFHLFGRPDRRRLLLEQTEDADMLLESICASVTEGNLSSPSTEQLSQLGFNDPTLQPTLENWFTFSEPSPPTPTPHTVPHTAPHNSPASHEPALESDLDATNPEATSATQAPEATEITDTTSAITQASRWPTVLLIPTGLPNRMQMLRVLGISNGEPHALAQALSSQRHIKVMPMQAGSVELETALLSPATGNTLQVHLIHARLTDSHGIILQLIAERESVSRLGTQMMLLLNEMARALRTDQDNGNPSDTQDAVESAIEGEGDVDVNIDVNADLDDMDANHDPETSD